MTHFSQQKIPPIIAILRGLAPKDAHQVCDILLEAGIHGLEIPLNRPNAFLTLEKIARNYSEDAWIGAGTVFTPEDVAKAANAGAQFIFSPHFDARLVAKCLTLSVTPVPGVATPTEGFAAIRAGAKLLKLFPAETITPPVVRAWCAVFPKEIGFISVGGIATENVVAYLESGANAVGIGSSLFKTQMSHETLSHRAKQFVRLIKERTPC